MRKQTPATSRTPAPPGPRALGFTQKLFLAFLNNLFHIPLGKKGDTKFLQNEVCPAKKKTQRVQTALQTPACYASCQRTHLLAEAPLGRWPGLLGPLATAGDACKKKRSFLLPAPTREGRRGRSGGCMAGGFGPPPTEHALLSGSMT